MQFKATVEKDENGRLTVLEVKKGTEQEGVRLDFEYGQDGYVRNILFTGRKDRMPSIPEIIDLVNESFIERIGTVKTMNTLELLKVIEEIGIIKGIETIESLPDVTVKGSEGIAFKQASAGAGSWVSPDGFEDPDNKWSWEANAYDDDTGSFAGDTVPAKSWGGFIVLTHAAFVSDRLRFWARYYASSINKVDIDVLVDGIWTDVYEGAFPDKEWVTKTFSQGSVTKCRFRFYNDLAEVSFSQLYEVDFWQVPATGGELKVEIHGDLGLPIKQDAEGYILTKEG